MSFNEEKLGNLVSFTRGLSYSKESERENEGTAVLRATNIDLETSKLVLDEIKYIDPKIKIKEEKIAYPGDILICTASGSKSHLGKVALIEKNEGMAFGGFMGVLRCKTKCNPKFLHLILTSSRFKSHLKQLSDGANINNLKFSQIEDFKFFLPTLIEQEIIVSKINRVFNNIDQLLSTIKKNKSNLNSLLSIQRNKIYEDLLMSEKLIALKEVVNLSRGHNPPKAQFIYTPREGYIRFYQIRDAKSDQYATYVPESKKLKKASKNDFLMNAYRHIGEVFTGVEGAFNVALCKLSIKDTRILEKDFLYFMIPSSLIKGRLLEISERSLIPSMSVKELSEIKIPLPSLEKQIKISSRIKKIEQLINGQVEIIDKKIVQYIALKSSILFSYV